MIEGQTNIFEMIYPNFKIDKPIRLIELFAGYGSQALALKYLGVEFEHWKICEWAIKSIQAYKDIHFDNKILIPTKVYSKEHIKEILYNLGISSNYNEPMTKEQINRLSTELLKNIYNNILLTNNLVNIQKVKGEDLEIEDTDKYCYIMTYSFPCQDLSLAGKGKGMSNTSTRSGMLWEVERILSECKELETMPQILLMENVSQVHGVDNVEDFNKWQLRLEELGYKNYWQDLIATDYGIPQTRNRTFMVSILGDYNYTFPKPIPLKLKLKDMLEDNVDEKYYLSEKMKDYILDNNNTQKGTKWEGRADNDTLNSNIAHALSVRGAGGSQRAGVSNFIIDDYDNEIKVKDIKLKRGYKCQVKKEKEDVKGIDVIGNYSKSNFTQTSIVNKNGVAPTITENHGQVTAIVDKPQVLGGYGKIGSTGQYHQQNRVYDDNVAISVTTAFNPYYKDNLRIRKLTPKECFRLMGVKDEDYEKCAKNQSDSSLYHLAGDSIVVNVLMAIFKEMIK